MCPAAGTLPVNDQFENIPLRKIAYFVSFEKETRWGGNINFVFEPTHNGVIYFKGDCV